MTYFVLTTLTIKYGANQKLAEAMKDLLPYMKSRGWHLQDAYQPVIGNFNKITHVWEIENIESVNDMLAGIASDRKIQDTVQAFAGYVEQEELQLVLKTPYSP